MRKLIILLVILIVITERAQAQSSVTLYGIIDEGLNYTSNAGGGRQISTSCSVLSGCRWGFRGSEDLGGGLRVIFTLENGFDLGTGRFSQGGDEWGRQAFFGLSSTHWGTLTLGRQYDSEVDYVEPMMAAVQWAGYPAAHAGDVDNMDGTNRVDNSIKY